MSYQTVSAEEQFVQQLEAEVTCDDYMTCATSSLSLPNQRSVGKQDSLLFGFGLGFVATPIKLVFGYTITNKKNTKEPKCFRCCKKLDNLNRKMYKNKYMCTKCHNVVCKATILLFSMQQFESQK